jgi:hypothetical protein
MLRGFPILLYRLFTRGGWLFHISSGIAGRGRGRFLTGSGALFGFPLTLPFTAGVHVRQ